MSKKQDTPIKVTAVEGNRQWLDGGAMFGNAPRAVWERWITPDALGRIPLACRSCLVEVGSKKILLETGIGSFFEPKLASRFGVDPVGEHLLLKNLNAIGVTENDIDYVVLSHLHFDHAGGLLPSFDEIQAHGRRLLFPRAKYVVGEQAWQRALQPHSRDKASFIDGLTTLLSESGRLIRVTGSSDLRVFPDTIEFFLSDGHTPGQMLTIVHGAHNHLVFCGDLIPGSPWIHLPITMGYDRFPELLIDEKLRLYQQADLNNWIFFFTHDPKIPAARVQNLAERYQLADPLTELSQYSLN